MNKITYKQKENIINHVFSKIDLLNISIVGKYELKAIIVVGFDLSLQFVDNEKPISFNDYKENKKSKSTVSKSYGIVFLYQAVTLVYLIFEELHKNGFADSIIDFVDYNVIEDELYEVVNMTIEEDYNPVSLITNYSNNWNHLEAFEKISNLIQSELNALKRLELASQQSNTNISTTIYEDNLLFNRVVRPKFKASDKEHVNTILELADRELKGFFRKKFVSFQNELGGNEIHLIDEYISYLTEMEYGFKMTHSDIIEYYEHKPYYEPDEFIKTDNAIYYSRLMSHILGKKKFMISIELLNNFFSRLRNNQDYTRPDGQEINSLLDLLNENKITFVMELIENIGVTVDGKYILGERKKSSILGIVEALQEKSVIPSIEKQKLCNLLADEINLSLASDLEESKTSKDFKKKTINYLKGHSL